MSFYQDQKTRTWVVQIQRTAPDGQKIRRCQRTPGSRDDAMALDKRMLKEVEAEVRTIGKKHQHEKEKKAAEKVLGIDPSRATKHNARKTPPTLREYLLGRWASHAAVVQGATTLRTTRSHVAYLCFYLGDLRLDEVDQAAVAKLREGLLTNGPQSFFAKKDGTLRKPRTTTFSSTSVNRILATLAAALQLAEREDFIHKAPPVDLLPKDDSQPIYPPTDAELSDILKTAPLFTDAAPFMVEAIELAAETGMRAGEQFTRTWACIDFKIGETGAIKVERQMKVKLVDGRPWTPKYKKSRIIPLTPRARQLLLSLRDRVPSRPDDPIIPSSGGCPYVRLEAAPDKSGIGYFPQVVEAAGISSDICWRNLRHYFAVRALLAGVPIAVVSAWLGHSDVNLTVKRYGRWAAEAREQWQWAKKMGAPIEAIPQRPSQAVLDGDQPG